MTYQPLDTDVGLPELDEDVLTFWRDHKVFARSLEQTADRPRWVFYEGPPTANGRPGIHHVEARAFKDAFPRYRTMKGFHVPRRAGWDCHGLPVELEVEKTLGLSSKAEIEAFGIAEFNARCRASVLAYVDAWVRMSDRMGYWADFEHAYRTMDHSYVESVWWALKQIYDNGLLVEDYRVAPYCPRCQTALSSHELGQPGVYIDIESPSAYVRLPITKGVWADQNADLLVWTTTPWTLVSNTAVAVRPDLTYVLAGHPEVERRVVVAEALLDKALGDGWTVLDSRPGADLEHTHYVRPFDLIDIPDAHYVVLAAFVTTDEGTGLVHLAPAFGADDLAVCKAYSLPVVNPIGADGHFDAASPMVGGRLFTDADPVLLADLDERGLLFRRQGRTAGGRRLAPEVRTGVRGSSPASDNAYVHAYPHCWRCGHSLLYYAMPSWYIRTTSIKEDLLAQNENTTWHPASVKHGRYGDWLVNNVDWALSRRRYWGTPLPVWRCDNQHTTCVGSLAELSRLAGSDLAALDPHRPFVDDIELDCPMCGATARRVPDVIDVWFDSGAMPFAQHGAPHRDQKEFERDYPAQFICEAIDQTRGWFYTMMAIGTLVFEKSSYENVVCVGLLLDADGRKMSKRLGNLMEPLPLMDRHGADAVRWFMLCSGSPWNDRRIGHEVLDEITRKVLLTYWNAAAFQSLYGRASNWEPRGADLGIGASDAEPPLLDRWIRSELAWTVERVDTAMDGFDSQTAGRRLAEFIDDLSNWYIRRSRRRFWNGDPVALGTLHECLDIVTRLLAPLVPFITERVWRGLFASTTDAAADSVHLASWPEPEPELVDTRLAEQMRLVRKVVDVGRAARASSGVKTRQPLSRALVAATGFDALPEELRAEITDELNVVALQPMDHAATVVDTSIRPRFRALGKRFGARTQEIANTLRAADPETTANALRTTGQVVLTVDGESVTLGPDEVEVTETPRTGWYVATDAGVTVALDLQLTPELRRAGIARDIVRHIQQARRAAGLDITDRIQLYWRANGEAARAVTEQQRSIADDVLATSMRRTEQPPPEAFATRDDDHGVEVWIMRVHPPTQGR